MSLVPKISLQNKRSKLLKECLQFELLCLLYHSLIDEIRTQTYPCLCSQPSPAGKAAEGGGWRAQAASKRVSPLPRPTNPQVRRSNCSVKVVACQVGPAPAFKHTPG